MKHRIFNTLLIVCSFALVFSCAEKDPVNNGNQGNDDKGNDKSIVIIYENDAHCNIDGYVSLAGYRDAILATDTAYVATVSSGDFLQGGAIGTFSKGEFIVDIMNAVGYDAVTIGNHELDYKMPRLLEMTQKLSAPVTCVNLTEVSSKNRIFAPFVLKQMGKKKVAFVGVLTPSTINSESYAFYDGDRNQLYELHDEDLNQLVQASVDEARSQGADYVILLSHLGNEKDSCESYTQTVVSGTYGIDAVLDGHTHALVNQNLLSNSKNANVILSQTGTKFSHIGVLTISKSGRLSSRCIPIGTIKEKSAKVQSVVDKVNEKCDETFNVKLSHSDFPLTITDEKGVRIVRNNECNLGDLIADGLRIMTGSQVGLINGGGISKGIPSGDITWRNVYDCQAFGNTVTTIKATGQQLIDHLELCAINYPYENGSFMQVSGIRFRLNPSAQPRLYIHKETYALYVDGPRRVTGVKILTEDGKYQNIDPEATYTIGTINFISDSGETFPCLIPCEKLENNVMSDVDCLGDYLASFGGKVPDIYSKPQGRININ